MFREIKPDIPESHVFNILGGIANSLYAFKIGKSVKVYILSGATERLRLENFFDYYKLKHEKLKIKDFIYGDKDFVNNFYILPIMATMINKYSFYDEDKNFLGFSFTMIDSYSEEENKFYLDELNVLPYNFRDMRSDWIYARELEKLNDYQNELIGAYCVYKIRKEDFINNEIINYYLSKKLKDLVIENIKNVLYGPYEKEKFSSVRGNLSYEYLIRHFIKLKNVLESDGNIKNYEGIMKYYKIQVLYLRNLLLSGTDDFYRGEFIDTLVELNRLYPDFNIEDIIEEWKKAAKLWRNIGRILMQLYIHISVENVDKLVNYINEIKGIEIPGFKKILNKLELIN